MFKKLKKYKLFPIMDLLAIVCFCFFVYNLTISIQGEESALGNKIEYLEDAVENPANI